MAWLIRPVVTSKNIVREYLVNGGLEPAFLNITVTRLSKLSRTQRDVVLALAQRIREAAKRDTLTIELPRLRYVQNIANSLIGILRIRNEATTEEVKEGIGKIPVSVIDRFVRSAAVNLQKKTLDFEKLSDVIKDNINDMVPKP